MMIPIIRRYNMKKYLYIHFKLLHSSVLFFISLFGMNMVHTKDYNTLIKEDLVVCLALMDDFDDIMHLDSSISYEYFKPLLLLYPEYQEDDQEVDKMLVGEIEKDRVWLIDCIKMKDQ